MAKFVWKSTKTYEHSVGLSCCFRQWRATHSHCQYLHGYALQIKLVFESPVLDTRNWVVDFGDLKKVKQWLQDTFDHKTLVAVDDPQINLFRSLDTIGLIQMVEVQHVGCEEFACMIYKRVEIWLEQNVAIPAVLRSVEVREHGGNSAIFERKETNYGHGSSDVLAEEEGRPAPGVIYKDADSRVIHPQRAGQNVEGTSRRGAPATGDASYLSTDDGDEGIVTLDEILQGIQALVGSDKVEYDAEKQAYYFKAENSAALDYRPFLQQKPSSDRDG